MNTKTIPKTETKRRRGAPRGNKNAAGNRGNRNARGAFGNRGGKGAPRGNQYALKKREPRENLIYPCGQDAELEAWLRANISST